MHLHFFIKPKSFPFKNLNSTKQYVITQTTFLIALTIREIRYKNKNQEHWVKMLLAFVFPLIKFDSCISNFINNIFLLENKNIHSLFLKRLYRCTLPLASPPANFSTSATDTLL